MSDDEAEMARLRKKRGFASCFDKAEGRRNHMDENCDEYAVLEKFVGRGYMDRMEGRQR